VALLVTGGWVWPNLGYFPPVMIACVLMAIGVVTFAYQLVTGPYVFRLDERGLHDRAGLFQVGQVGWDDLEKATVVIAAGRKQIGILLTPEARARRSAIVRSLMDELRKETGADVVVTPEALGPASAEEHVALLERYRSSVEARAELRA
jgi:hypothetical protein